MRCFCVQRDFQVYCYACSFLFPSQLNTSKSLSRLRNQSIQNCGKECPHQVAKGFSHSDWLTPFPPYVPPKFVASNRDFRVTVHLFAVPAVFSWPWSNAQKPWYQWFVSWPQPPENSNTQYKTKDGWPAGACRTLHPHEWKWYHSVAKEEMEAAIMADVVQCRGCIDMSQQDVDWNVVLIVMLRMFYTAPCSPSWFLAYVV